MVPAGGDYGLEVVSYLLPPVHEHSCALELVEFIQRNELGLKSGQQVFAETGRYNRIGTYWERGNQNEIDLVAVNDLRKEVVFADIKLDSSRINLKALKEKASKLSDEYKGYKKEWLGLHIQNIREFLK